MKKNSLPDKAYQYAIDCHKSTNHLYDSYLPYEFHLRMVVNVANNFLHLVPSEKREIVMAACWAHDLIEDCRQNYNDVKEILGEEVAEIVYAVTNEKGKNRTERANQKYYDGIKANHLAIFVKLCDKIANVQYSIMNQSHNKLKIYESEHENFYHNLYHPDFQVMFEYLERLFKQKSIF
ncbi:MAG: hypothetical protein OHK0038_25540 [Flammeovirgaceae bacterium]